MTDAQITITLATTAMGWRAGAGRFIVSPDRRWIPAHQFSPLTNIQDAFKLLSHTRALYTVSHFQAGNFSVRVQINGRFGTASSSSPARAISMAVAAALGIDMEAAR